MKWTIQRKFFIGFFLLFFVAACVFNVILATILEKHTTSHLETNVSMLQFATTQYMKQFEQLHNQEGDFFMKERSQIANELSRMNAQSVALYDSNGYFLYEAVPIHQPFLMEHQRFQTNIDQDSSEELTQALQNKSAYTIQHVENGTLLYFAFPLYIEDTFYGVIRFTADYTAVFQHNDRLSKSFILLTILLFVGVFFLSLFITKQLSKPLRNLTEVTKRMAQGDYYPMNAVKRTDEIGELAKHFKLMQHEIQQHIATIEFEKEKVLLLEEKRKSFFHNITHELKTPLTAISGYAQIIGEKEFDDAVFLEKAAQKIRSESDRLNDLVSQLLTLSKYQSETPHTRMEMVNIYSLAQSAVEDMQIKAAEYEKDIVLEGRAYEVLGHPHELRQLFINLIDNAIYHGVGPNIFIKIDDDIVVQNLCSPISPAILNHIFEPFVHRKHENSTGLGLFICADIVARHQGTIHFEERQGQALVTISIPSRQQHGNN